MPKARKRKKVIGRDGATQARAANTSQSAALSQNGRGDPALAGAARVNRPVQSQVVRGPQSLIFPTMVALGCWGMAFTFLFLSNDPNRAIFGVMAVLMALLWSFSLGIRVRKLMQQRSQVQ
jgi:hypothetical protein